MKLLVYLVLILVCAANLFAHASEKEATARLPADVAKFKERRDICDHFRGEEPYDAERRKFLEENLNKYCTGTDKELASLKAKKPLQVKAR